MNFVAARLPLFLLTALLLASCRSTEETVVVVQRPSADVSEAEPDIEEDLPALPAPEDLPEVERFSGGRMWTLEQVPSDHFETEYGFRADSTWLRRARGATLRLPNCTASFVSGRGLVATNYHCVRQLLHKIDTTSVDLRETGFLADSMGAERRVPDLYADQLVGTTDLTTRVRRAVDHIVEDDRRAEVLRRTIERLEESLTREAKLEDTTLHVQVIELHRGVAYMGYRYKRYHDLRLVMVPEAAVGSFGGDTDNFTFPRHTLDVAFFRAYDPEANPVVSDFAFDWSDVGVTSGDVVFVTGNPGTTNRLISVSAMIHERDVDLPNQLQVIRSREEALRSFIQRYPAAADSLAIGEILHSVANSRKEAEGRLHALTETPLVDRVRAIHARSDALVGAVDTLRAPYRSTLRQIDDLQQSKRGMARQHHAFAIFGSSNFESHILIRALYAYLYDFARQRNASADFLENYRRPGRAVEYWPPELEKAYLAQRLRELRDHLGAADPTVRSILGGRTPSAVAEDLVDRTALADSAGFDSLIQRGYQGSGDATVPIAQAIVPLYLTIIQQRAATEARENRLSARLAEIRMAAGEDVVPDATFSLRISDGIVEGYSVNGSPTPAHSTFFGMYNLNASRPPGQEWDLPERWHGPPSNFDLSTPLNFVTTADITGGSSGSPVFSREFELVGIAFDSNMEALGNMYAYTEEDGARAIAVDTRAVTEALRAIYDADDLLDELLLRGEAASN